MAKNEMINKELDYNFQFNKSIYDDFGEEDLKIFSDFYKSYYDAYVKNVDSVIKWKEIADKMYYGELKKDSAEKMKDKTSMTAVEYLKDVKESPVTNVILKHKTASLLGIDIYPTLAQWQDPSKSSAKGGIDIKLNDYMTWSWNKYIDDYNKTSIIEDGERYGVGFLKLEISGMGGTNHKQDIKVSPVSPTTMMLDYTKTITEQDVVIQVKEIKKSDMDMLPAQYSERLQEVIDQNVLGKFLNDEEKLEMLEVYIKGGFDGKFDTKNVKKIVVIDEVIVDIIDTTYVEYPFGMYTPGRNSEVYKTSSLYLLVDKYDMYTRIETAINRLVGFITNPQMEFRTGDLVGNLNEITIKANYPGAVFQSETGQSIRIIDRMNEVMNLKAIQDGQKNEMYETIGLTPINMGQTTGSLQGTGGIQSAISTANKPLNYSLPMLGKFYEDFTKMFYSNVLMSAQEGQLIYLSKDDEGQSKIDSLKLEDYKDSSFLNFDITIDTEETNSQVGINYLIQLLGMTQQYQADEAGEVKQALLGAAIDLIPIDGVTKASIRKQVLNLLEVENKARSEGVAQGSEATAQIMAQAMKGTQIQ